MNREENRGTKGNPFVPSAKQKTETLRIANPLIYTEERIFIQVKKRRNWEKNRKWGWGIGGEGGRVGEREISTIHTEFLLLNYSL